VQKITDVNNSLITVLNTIHVSVIETTHFVNQTKVHTENRGWYTKVEHTCFM